MCLCVCVFVCVWWGLEQHTIGSNNGFGEQSKKFRFRKGCELLQRCASKHRQLRKNLGVACLCPNYCSSITSWFGQSYCLTAYTYISTSFWLHCSHSSAYFGPTDSGLNIYNPHAYKFLADVCIHSGPSAEVFQINGLNCDKLYTANVFEKSRRPKRVFPSYYRHVFALHLTVFYIIFPAWRNTERAAQFMVTACLAASARCDLHPQYRTWYTQAYSRDKTENVSTGITYWSRYRNFVHSADYGSILTILSRVVLEKLTGFQLVNSPHFMEPESSLPHSQMPATCPYPEPARSSPYPHIPLPEDPS